MCEPYVEPARLPGMPVLHRVLGPAGPDKAAGLSGPGITRVGTVTSMVRGLVSIFTLNAGPP